MYNVEDKLVELKTPIYEYYYAYKNISIGETLKNEILEKDIPTGVNIKTIYNPSYIKDEGYYCIINKKREYFGILNSEKHPFENPSENEVFIELFDAVLAFSLETQPNKGIRDERASGHSSEKIPIFLTSAQ